MVSRGIENRWKWSLSLFFILMLSLISTEGTAKNPWEIIVCNPLLHQLEKESTWAAAKAIGVEALEIHVNTDLKCTRLFEGDKTPYSLDSLQNAQAIAKAAKKHNLRTPVLCFPIGIGNTVTDEEYIEKAKTLIDAAQTIGCKHIYLPIRTTGPQRARVTDEQFIASSIKIIKQVAPYGFDRNVGISMENLSMHLNQPSIVQQILDQVSDKRFGLTLDPINLYWYGYPRSKVYEIIKKFAPRIRYFHAKNVAYPSELIEQKRKPGYEYIQYSVPIEKGDLDFEWILGEAYKAGYKGWISVEDDSLSHVSVQERVEVLRRDIRYLQSIVSKLE